MYSFRLSDKNAFTLAEVIITVGLIGIIAACCMPALLNNIQQRVRENSAAVFSRKFASVVEVVQAANSFDKFNSTEDFVNTLEKQLRIIKKCDAAHITDCWPSQKVILYDGSEFNIAAATDGETAFLMNYKDPEGKQADYTSDNVALVLADGTSVLMSYNTKCHSDDPQFSQNCVAAIFEINGSKGPNELGKDVILFNAKYFVKMLSGNSDDIECTGTSAARRF